MSCQKCESDRVIRLTGKCADLCFASFRGIESDGEAPDNIGLGGGDYIKVNVCLECGQVQGEFPVPDPEFAYEDED